MFFKNRKHIGHDKKGIKLLPDDTHIITNSSNFILFNDAHHAYQFINYYIQEHGFKRIVNVNLSKAFTGQEKKIPDSFKKQDLVLYEPECYIIDKHAVLVSKIKLNQLRLHDLPDHQIIVAKMSRMVSTLSQGMQYLRRTYSKQIPTGITSMDLTGKNHILLILINNSL